MNDLTEGRIVHFVMADGQHRPGIVVRVWSATCINLILFVDGSNDGYDPNLPLDWKTSIVYSSESKEPGTWHWIEGD